MCCMETDMSSMTKTIDFERKLLNLSDTCCGSGNDLNIKSKYNIKTKYNIFTDITSFNPEAPLDRKTAAAYAHSFLLNAIGEEDEAEIDPAFKLADIYECKVCSMHIAQVYCKGIMEAKECKDNESRLYFDLAAYVDETEQDLIIRRMLDPHERVRHGDVRGPAGMEPNGREPNSYEHAGNGSRIVRHINISTLKNLDALFVDIRSRSEYELGTVYEGINIPMDELIRNPYCLPCDIEANVVVWSNDASRSEIVSKCLADAGYISVFILDELDATDSMKKY